MEAVAYLHLQGVSLIPYRDDLLTYGQSLELVRVDVDRVILTLETLGWIVNWEKSSSLIPSQIKTFLGYLVDARAQTFSPRGEKG